MARFEKSRPKSAKPHAAVATPRRATTAPSIEDTMFFPRLRRHAKWMFVLLALIFGLGFVLFGVGAGGVGVGDVFRDAGGTSAQSVSDAREKTEDTPEGPGGLDRALDRPADRGRDGRGDRRARSGDRAPPEGSRCRTASSPGLHLTQATKRQQDGQLAQSWPRSGRPRRRSSSSRRRPARPSSPDPIAARDQLPRRATRATTAYQDAQTVRRPSRSTRTSSSPSSSRTTRTCSSSSPRPRSRPATRPPRSPRTSSS